MDAETIEALYKYDTWANDRVLEAVGRLAPADLPTVDALRARSTRS